MSKKSEQQEQKTVIIIVKSVKIQKHVVINIKKPDAVVKKQRLQLI